MNRKDLKEAYEYPSKQTSEILRYLALAGVAIIWMFKEEVDGKRTIPDELFWPLLLIICGLLVDFFHYAFLAHTHHRCFVTADRSAEKIDVPPWYAMVGWVMWYIKIAIVLVGYGFLLRYLSSKLFS